MTDQPKDQPIDPTDPATWPPNLKPILEKLSDGHRQRLKQDRDRLTKAGATPEQRAQIV